MRLNENTKIVGKGVILVPYEAKHVEKYHKWMQSSELQELTASVPLTLAEEYDMQLSWREDENKCTFLVLCRQSFEQTGDEIAALIGDTNLFLGYDEDTRQKYAEAEIMIAEKSARGNRYGWEAMLLMLKYAQINLNIDKFIAKIGVTNESSLNMFKKMNFQEVTRSDVFKEVTVECTVDDTWIKWLDKQVTLECSKYIEDNSELEK